MEIERRASIHLYKDKEVSNKFLEISKHILVWVFGLLPLFFVPVSFAPFYYSKTLFVVVGLAIALIFYILSALMAGSIKIHMPFAIVAIWSLAAASSISALFSGDMQDSFIGDSLNGQTALFQILLALIATVVVLLLHDKKDIMQLFLLLTASTVILGIYHIVRSVAGADTFSFGVFNSLAQTPLGGWNDLGVFFGLSIL